MSHAADTRPAADDGTAAVTLELEPPVPAEVPVGSAITFKIRASCASGHDLAGARIELHAGEAIVATGRLVSLPEDASAIGVLASTAPAQGGPVTWTVHLPAQEVAAVALAASTLTITFATVPLRTSLAVWDVPSPIAAGQRFRIKVGAKSSGGCSLAGTRVEIVDQSGAEVGHGELGETPWPETDALYWSEIELAAPAAACAYSWTVTFAPAGQPLPHSGTSSRFGFAAVPPPESRLTVSVTDQTDGAPIADVQLALGPYRAATDATGMALLHAPRGTYRLAFWKALFEAAEIELELVADASVAMALKRLPEEVKIWG